MGATSFQDMLDVIENWSDFAVSQNSSSIKSLLGAAIGFELPKSLYDNWNHTSSNDIHIYLALSDDHKDLGFVVVDKESDEAYGSGGTMDMDNIDVFSVVNGTPNFSVGTNNPTTTTGNAVSPSDTISRTSNWEDYHESWVDDELQSGQGFLKAFSVSMDDVTIVETSSSWTKIYVVLGLQPASGSGYNADVILVNGGAKSNGVINRAANVTTLVPPLGSSFNLLS